MWNGRSSPRPTRHPCTASTSDASGFGAAIGSSSLPVVLAASLGRFSLVSKTIPRRPPLGPDRTARSGVNSQADGVDGMRTPACPHGFRSYPWRLRRWRLRRVRRILPNRRFSSAFPPAARQPSPATPKFSPPDAPPGQQDRATTLAHQDHPAAATKPSKPPDQLRESYLLKVRKQSGNLMERVMFIVPSNALFDASAFCGREC